MNKSLRTFFCLLLLLSLLLSFSCPVFAAENKEEEEAEDVRTELHIRSEEDFLKFAKNCVQDHYSSNLTVFLDANLDLEGVNFAGIPIFTGIFHGNHHTIRGIRLDVEGSTQGLFRYVTRGALIDNLSIEGLYFPEGTKNSLGGLAGSNAGTIKGCRFQGELEGCEHVGGIAGINQVSGIIENCQVSGTIRGTHFVGGIAGENQGSIRFCKNFTNINTAAEDNNIDSIEFTPEFITGKESAETVTDLGGIAGTSTGVIRDCTNLGSVGYPHMGYNIGGIAGSQRGYITRCENFSPISGRKEIGGIAGQMEPVANIVYTKDTLQILREQLETTSNLANRASADISSGSSEIRGDISAMHEEAGVALEAVEELFSGDDFPDLDTIIAANNVLSGSIGSMQNIASSLHDSLESTVSTAAGDIRAITKQVSAMSHTLDTAAENLGGTVTDVSDQDTEDNLTAKVSQCKNHGEILGDLNVGGITGAIAWENDKDPEGDFEVTGERSLNFDSELRAVILECKNTSIITAKKCNAGGIAGTMTMGLVKDSDNTGILECEDASYLGGIAGLSNGFIRNCNSKSKITGKAHVGGIAGQAPILTGCRSIVLIEEGAEKLGSIAGEIVDAMNEEKNPVSGNYYLPLSDHLGAIDGIDYYEVADSLTKKEFQALDGLSPLFIQASMTFQFPDGTSQQLVIPLGEVVSEDRIPTLPKKEGYIAQWTHLDEIDLQNLFLDGIFEAEYIPCHAVRESSLRREDGKPVLLAEGLFESTEELHLTQQEDLPEGALEGWKLPAWEENNDELLIHLSLPEELIRKEFKVLVQDAQGHWQEVPSSEDGSYALFKVHAADQAVAVLASHETLQKQLTAAASAAGVLLILLALFIHRKHKKKKAAAKKA